MTKPIAAKRIARGVAACFALAALVSLFQNCGSSFESASTGQSSVGPAAGQCVSSLSPRRVWMLSRAEYDNSVLAALGDASGQARRNFPNESRRNGFISNADGMVVSPGLVLALMNAAEAIAAGQAPRIATTLGCSLSGSPAAAPADSCAIQMINSTGKALFRRPLTADETAGLYTVYLTGFQNPYPEVAAAVSGVQLVITAMLQAPGFLYRTELGDPADTDSQDLPLTPHELANALSYLTTGFPPDATLMALADSGQLNTPEALDAQARRLLAMPAGRDRLAQFFTELIGADTVDTIGTTAGPLTPAIAADMLTETKKFLAYAIFSGSGNLSEILSADYTFVNSSLAGHYGIQPAEPTATFRRVALNGGERKGLLSQGSFLATSGRTSVPLFHRGKILRSKMFCQQLPTFASLGLAGFSPPPLGTPGPNQSWRQLVEQKIPKGTTCYACHQHFEPIGYGLESFDSFGRFRTMDNGVPVDPSGEILMATGNDPGTGMILTPYSFSTTPFADFSAMADLLANSKAVHACFTKHVVTFSTGRVDVMNNDCNVNSMQSRFSSSGMNVLEAFSLFVQSPQFSRRGR